VTERELWSYTFRRSNLVELARAAAAAGFDCVTTTTALYARSVADHPDLRARVEGHGVRVTFIDGLATALPGTNLPPGEATLDECVEMAHAVGAGAINVVHMTGRPMPLAEMADAFAAACARAAAEELRLAIEFIPDTGIPDFATAAAIVREAGAPNGSVLLDTWHFARGAGDFVTLDDDALSLVGGVQLSDRTPDQDAQPYVPRKGRKIPGDGELPLARLTAELRRLHPELPIGVEVLSDEIDDLGLDAGARRLAASLEVLLRD
jgi:sugar phosphate isomerase/epimerase